MISTIASVATAFAALLAFITLLVNGQNRRTDATRIKKQATLDAINVLQNDVFDEMAYYSKEDVKSASVDTKCEGYKHFGALLARCEHFSVGVDSGIYDYETTKNLCGNFLWPLYDKFIPLIEEKRMLSGGKELYSSFQNLAVKLKEECD